jgi:HD domain-containing protein
VTRGFGTQAWLAARDGRLTLGDRLALLGGLATSFVEGVRLARHARRSGRRDAALADFAPPDTPMVRAARAHLLDACTTPLVNHSMRTAYWTLLVLHQHGEVTPEDRETAWAAALLHDVGLERPLPQREFALAGIAALHGLARETGWPAPQLDAAAEAIATNLSLRVDPARSGRIAWAMNVGGAGELGGGPHRGQMHPARVAELEAMFPRTGFKSEALRLIRADARRFRGGRWGFFRWVFPLAVKR